MMDAVRWERAKELYEAAREREEPERSRFLTHACQDDEELRQEVESLLSANQNAGDFMKSDGDHLPPDTISSDKPISAFSAGQIICERYEILRMIGRGGMGEVYEARDLEIGTHVALKTIRPELSAYPQTLQRFRRELKLGRSVTHPNVCPMYHLEPYRPPGDNEGPPIIIITMKLLEGETLAARLRRQGRMTTVEALPLVRQMAEGLAAAHEVGVVHCDFKPGNVMLVTERPTGVDSEQSTRSLSTTAPLSAAIPTAGVQTEPNRPDTPAASLRAVITDFGLARAIAPSSHESAGGSLGAGGHLVGTPAYMAPEQLEGRKVTAATDVYALGLVIYEMLTGHRPFEGDPYRRLREQLVPARARVPELDPRWERVIGRCLEKDPAARYASAKQGATAIHSLRSPGSDEDDVQRKRRVRRRVLAAGLATLAVLAMAAAALWLFDLQLWQRLFGPPLPAHKILAVLPCKAVNSLPEELARCNGLTETVTAKLAQFDSVELPAAAVVQERHIDSIAKARTQLGATMVLEASWQQVGPSARITLSLVDAKTGRELRTDSVTAAAQDDFSLQDEAAVKCAQMLELQLSPGSRENLTAHGTGVLTAYDFYLQGLGYLQGYQKLSNVDLAISLFQRAISEDQHYAQAQATLSLAYWYKYNATRDAQWADKAKAAVDAAAKLDSGLLEVQLAIGDSNQRTGDYGAAVAAFQRALSLDPRNVEAYGGLGRAYESLDRLQEAEKAFQAAVQVRPACWDCYDSLGTFFYNHARYDEALQAWQTLIALAPDNEWGYMNVGNVYLVRADFVAADDYYRRALKLDPDGPDSADVYTNLGTTSYYLRHFEEEERYCEKAKALNPKKYDYWVNLGDAYRMIPADAGKAREAYRQAILLAAEELRVNPRNATVLGMLAQCHARLGHAKTAREYLAKALNLEPNNANVLFSACIVHLESGERQEALNSLSESAHTGYPAALLAADPQFDTFRSDPGFERIVNGAHAHK